MSQPLLEKEANTTEYVTQEAIDKMFQAIVDRLDDTETRLREQIERVEQSSTERFDTLKEENRTINERLDRERKQREDDIASFRDEFRGELKGIGDKIDSLSGGVSSISGGLSEIKGLMTSFQDSLKNRDEKDIEAHKRIDSRIDEQSKNIGETETILQKVQNNVATLDANQAALSTNMSRLQTTIHGDPNNKDDAPSLFGMIGDLKEQVSLGFTQTQTTLNTVRETSEQNQRDITAINEARAQEKARWDEWISSAKTFGLAVLNNRWVQLALAAILTGIVVSIFPELREIIVSALTNQIEQGVTP